MCAAASAALAARAIDASAAANPLSLRVVGDTQPVGLNLVTASVGAPAGYTCTMRVKVGHSARTFRSRRTGSVVWRWTAVSSASKGIWTFVAVCRDGASWWWREYRTEMGFPEPGGALLGGSAPAPAPAGAPTSIASSCDAEGVCFSSDVFPVGQCTWYAQGRRPDLSGIAHGNAWEWLAAAAGRAPEGTKPEVGAIAVWMPDVPPAGAIGHVGYVAAVAGSRILVDDSNWPPTPWSPPLQVHEHWEPAAAVGGYIYRLAP